MSRYIPQEIGFNISRYGQVLPGLSAEYILTEVNNASNGRSINWASELMIEYLRKRDPWYNRLKPILEAITKLVDESGISLVVWEGDRPKIDLSRAHITSIFNGTVLKPVRSNMVQVSREDYSDEIKAIRVSGDVVNLQDLNSLGLQQVYIDNDWIVIPIGSDITPDDLNRALYLTRPRSNQVPKESADFMYTRDISIPNKNLDYPWIIGTASRSNIPGYEGRELSDIDLIRLTLTLNPRYDLGSLLEWIGRKGQACDVVSRYLNEQFQAIVDSEVVWMTSSGYDDIMIRTRGANNRPIIEYMASVGVPLTEIGSKVLESSGVHASLDIILNALVIEMCLLDYKATINDIMNLWGL